MDINQALRQYHLHAIVLYDYLCTKGSGANGKRIMNDTAKSTLREYGDQAGRLVSEITRMYGLKKENKTARGSQLVGYGLSVGDIERYVNSYKQCGYLNSNVSFVQFVLSNGNSGYSNDYDEEEYDEEEYEEEEYEEYEEEYEEYEDDYDEDSFEEEEEIIEEEPYYRQPQQQYYQQPQQQYYQQPQQQYYQQPQQQYYQQPQQPQYDYRQMQKEDTSQYGAKYEPYTAPFESVLNDREQAELRTAFGYQQQTAQRPLNDYRQMQKEDTSQYGAKYEPYTAPFESVLNDREQAELRTAFGQPQQNYSQQQYSNYSSYGGGWSRPRFSGISTAEIRYHAENILDFLKEKIGFIIVILVVIALFFFVIKPLFFSGGTNNSGTTSAVTSESQNGWDTFLGGIFSGIFNGNKNNNVDYGATSNNIKVYANSAKEGESLVTVNLEFNGWELQMFGKDPYELWVGQDCRERITIRNTISVVTTFPKDQTFTVAVFSGSQTSDLYTFKALEDQAVLNFTCEPGDIPQLTYDGGTNVMLGNVMEGFEWKS